MVTGVLQDEEYTMSSIPVNLGSMTVQQPRSRFMITDILSSRERDTSVDPRQQHEHQQHYHRVMFEEHQERLGLLAASAAAAAAGHTLPQIPKNLSVRSSDENSSGRTNIGSPPSHINHHPHLNQMHHNDDSDDSASSDELDNQSFSSSGECEFFCLVL